MKRVLKNKSNKIILAICSFVFLLSLIGIIRVAAAEPNFKLVNATITDKSSEVSAVINSYQNNVLDTDVVFHKLNDYVVFKLSIKNNTSKDLKVKLIDDNNANTNVEYTYDPHTNEDVAAGATLDVELTATYKNSLTSNLFVLQMMDLL